MAILAPEHQGTATVAHSRAPALPSWSHPLAFFCFLAAVFFLPVQLELPAVKSILGSRLAPSDVLLACSILLAPGSLRMARQPAFLLPVALLATLSVGVVLALVVDGSLTDHALRVKFAGGLVLVALGITSASYARHGHGPTLARWAVIGFAFWGLVAFVDFRIANVVPFLDSKVASRFGGMQFDPNNAGAGFGAALALSWRFGHQLFKHRLTWMLTTAGLGGALLLTVSRGAMLGVAAAFVVVLFFDRVSAQRWIRYMGVASIILVGAVAAGLVQNAVDDLERRPDTVEERNELTEAALDWFIESRGLGIGLGTSFERGEKIIHNTAIWLMVEMSIVGVLFFSAMVLLPLFAALKLRARNRDFALGILGAHVVMIVASMGIEALYQRQWWLIVGLTVIPLGAMRPAVPEAERSSRGAPAPSAATIEAASHASVDVTAEPSGARQ